MKTATRFLLDLRCLTLVLLFGLIGSAAATSELLQVGLAVRDITPTGPIWLAGYAARTHPATNTDTPLLVQALAFKNPTGERVVLVALDNCEVGGEFIRPTLRQLEEKHQLPRGSVMIVCSHTHAGPVLEGSLIGMYPLEDIHREQIAAYGQMLKAKTAEAVDAALAETQPAVLEHAVGRARFAVNRRVPRENAWVFGENTQGPVDHDVPVLKILGTNGAVRVIVFGYACHATSIHGADFYTVSGDYIAYARRHLEGLYPGATAFFLTGMGADSNPSPRGSLKLSQLHGAELARAVVSVLERPMNPVRAPFKLAYAEVELPFQPAPPREQIERDRTTNNPAMQKRAAKYLEQLEQGRPVRQAIELPVAALRFSDDLLVLAMGGEVVVDYALEYKRRHTGVPVWTVGYAYEVPCYIPSRRILREGGYEPDSSLIYYGWYGPFRPEVEDRLLSRMGELVKSASQ